LKGLVDQIITVLYEKDYLPTRRTGKHWRGLKASPPNNGSRTSSARSRQARIRLRRYNENIKPKMDDAGRAKVENVPLRNTHR